MNVLLVHQNFPGQYLHLARHLRDMGGHHVVGLGEDKNIQTRGIIRGITTIGYPTPEGSGDRTHVYLQSTEAAVRRGQAVARSLLDLRKKGFAPDVISVHPGWGEGLFVRDVFPDAAILVFCEYYFKAGEADLDFDPEFPEPPSRFYSIRFLNTPQIMSIITANACLSPTRWQTSRYPAFIREKIHIIHDGVDTARLFPDSGAQLVLQPLRTPGESRVTGYSLRRSALIPPREGKHGEFTAAGAARSARNREKPGAGRDAGQPGFVRLSAPDLADAPCGASFTLSRKDKVITYIGRSLEPYRGFHVFLRALPALQKLHPDAHVLIAGKDGVSYSPALPEGQSYKARYMKEMEGRLDLSRVHCLGHISYEALRALYCISSAHVYLTYPFVLSWSMLEAMSCESLVVASRTAPVEEVISHGENGLLVDFFDRDDLVATLDKALRDPGAYAPLRAQARKTILERYDLRDSLQRQYRLLTELAAGKYPIPDA